MMSKVNVNLTQEPHGEDFILRVTITKSWDDKSTIVHEAISSPYCVNSTFNILLGEAALTILSMPRMSASLSPLAWKFIISDEVNDDVIQITYGNRKENG